MIIMLFKEINKRDFDKLALKMFSILSSNMEIMPSYQVRFGVLSGLFRFMRYRIPDNITSVSAYISKNNPRSCRIAEKLGLSADRENASATSFLYSGDIQHILKRYLK